MYMLVLKVIVNYAIIIFDGQLAVPTSVINPSQGVQGQKIKTQSEKATASQEKVKLKMLGKLNSSPAKQNMVDTYPNHLRPKGIRNWNDQTDY